jgi:4-amino-4-deoxy-L-arabinose transferase-like glycosyltransferase
MRILADTSVNRTFLAGAVLFCFFSSVLYVLSPPGAATKENDANGYRKQTESFLKTGHFRPFKIKKSILMHPPGFTLFVSGLYLISNNNPGLVVFVHCLIALASIFLLMQIAQLLFDEQTAKITCLLACCNIGYLVYAQYLLMETLIVFLLTFFWERFFRYHKTKKKSLLLQGGLLLGISLWIKPVAMFYGPLVILFLLLWSSDSFKEKLQQAGWFALGFYIPFIILSSYNFFAYGVFGNSKAMYQNIFSYFIPQIMGLKTGVIPEKARSFVGKELQAYGITRTIPGAFWYCYKNSFLSVYVWTFNMFKTFFGLYATQVKVLFNTSLKGGQCSFFIQSGSAINRLFSYCFMGSTHWLLTIISFLEIMWNIVRCGFLLIMSLRLFNENRLYVLSFIWVTMLYFIGITGHDGMARYRMMVEPLVILGSAYGISLILFSWQTYKNNRYIKMQSRVV